MLKKPNFERDIGVLRTVADIIERSGMVTAGPLLRSKVPAHLRDIAERMADEAFRFQHQVNATKPGEAMQMKEFDPVQRPAHYARGTLEHCDTFEAKCEAVEEINGIPSGSQRFLGGMEHNATKYLWRAGEKPFEDVGPGAPSVLRDWEKAAWYVARGIKHLKALINRQQKGE